MCIRDRDIQFTQSWKIECYAKSYTPEVGHCNLCATEKYLIVKNFRNRNLVNDRSSKNIWLSEFFSILLLTIMCDGCQFFRQRRIVNAVTHLKHYVKQESVPSKLLKYIKNKYQQMI